MIGVTIHQRKPRSEQQYQVLAHGETAIKHLPPGLGITIRNTTGVPLYLKWRI